MAVISINGISQPQRSKRFGASGQSGSDSSNVGTVPLSTGAPRETTAISANTLTDALKSRNNITVLPTFGRGDISQASISARAGHPVLIARAYEDDYLALLEKQRSGLSGKPGMVGIIDEIDGKPMMMDLDTKFFNQDIIQVEGPVTDYMASELTKQLRYLVSKRQEESSNEPIRMLINSPGGSMFAMNAITDAMQMARETKVNGEPLKIIATITGMAASAGSIIAASASEVYMTPTAMYMLHAPISGANGEFHDMNQSIRLTHRMWQLALDIYRKKMGYPQSVIAKWTEQGERWLDPKQAMRAGLCEGMVVAYDKVVSRDEVLGKPFEKGKEDLFKIDKAHHEGMILPVEDKAV